MGPELLARLRQDEDWVAALLHKAHYQNVYALDLGDASEDSTSVALSDGRTISAPLSW